MRKYKPIKLWIILVILLIIEIVIYLFLKKEWEKIIVAIISLVSVIFLIFSLTFYTRVEDDKIVFTHGLYVLSKTYKLKSKIIRIDNISNIEIYELDEKIYITLKNGVEILFYFNYAYFNSNKIIKEFEAIKNKLNRN